jgi:hypothetical protein
VVPHAPHAGLPGVVDAFQPAHLLLQLRQTLGLAEQLLQIAAANPHGAAALATHLAVIPWLRNSTNFCLEWL